MKILTKVESSSLSKLYEKMLKSDCGIITPFRGEFSHRENLQRLHSLYVKLSSPSLSLTAVQGYFLENKGTLSEKWVKETGYFVTYSRSDNPNKIDLKEKLLKLGEEFDQDSIFWIPKNEICGYEIGTSKRPDVDPAYHQWNKFDKISFGKENQFMTKVNKRPFYFEKASTFSSCPSTFSMQSISNLCKKDWRDLKELNPFGD